jgi:hypothetical protein
MKLILSIGILSICFATAVSAHGIPTVEHMSCSAAQAFVAKHGRYYKDMGVDGAIPIYPAQSLQKANCGGRTMTSPQMERTLDNKHCIVSWYCRAQ